jgi:tetratricopeptide (TPR) repeat protein
LSADTRSSAAQQKIALLCDLGRGKEEAQRYDQLLASQSMDPVLWVLCTAAHYMAGEPEQALQTAQEGLVHFPANAALYVYNGYIFRDQEKYREAFSCWEQALALDPDFLDARYAMGFCLEQMGEYGRAREVWHSLALELEQKGFEEEVAFPLVRERECAEQHC